MGINFNLLKSNLNEAEIEWLPATTGVQEYQDGGKRAWAQLVAYKNARVDMERLDLVCGSECWQNNYKRDSSGILQCGIGIFNEGAWIWKWSNGVPSNFHKEKGEYSDAFKRAAFLWGIGRELYELPSLFVELNEDEYYVTDNGGKKKVNTTRKFDPSSWQWRVNWDHKDANGKTTGLIWAKQKQYSGDMKFRVKNTPITKPW